MTKDRETQDADFPRLAPGTQAIIASTALVIDAAGAGWWIVIGSDGTREIIRAFG